MYNVNRPIPLNKRFDKFYSYMMALQHAISNTRYYCFSVVFSIPKFSGSHCKLQQQFPDLKEFIRIHDYKTMFILNFRLLKNVKST